MKADTNYLYILFAVVYVIYSIIKAGKKVTKNRPTIDKNPQAPPASRPTQPPSAPETNSGDELKKMLEELLGGGAEEEQHEPEVIRPKPTVVYEKPQPKKVPANFSHKEKKTSSPARPNVATPAHAFVAHPEIVKKAFVEPVQEETADVDFDIREAVIYSEILKRPQY